jgi:plastocyanin
MRRGLLWAVALIFSRIEAADAASLVVKVTDPGGKAVADAVAKLTADGLKEASGDVQPHVIDQRNETFIPYVEIVPAGGEVTFRNSDQTRHHVYSFSPLGLFEFLLAPGDRSAPVRLAHPGIIAVGCNIHDPMIAYLYVSDSPLVARSDPQGMAEIKAVPAGRYVLHLWHPRLRPGRQELTQSVTVEGNDVQLAVIMELLPDRRSGDERRRY